MPARFATTRWSVVLAARAGGGAESRQALEELCSAYWLPLYAFVRRQGYSADEAADLTQAYFARFLEKDFLGDVRRHAGRFRSFLLSSLRHFLANEWDRAAARRRGGGQPPLSLDFARAEGVLGREPADERTPEREYERRWALVVLERALGRLRDEAAAAGKAERFARLEPFLVGGEEDAYAPAAAELRISETAARVAVHRLRKRLGECLRAEIAQTVAQPGDVEDELRHLLASLG